jgi:hypothetical protein
MQNNFLRLLSSILISISIFCFSLFLLRNGRNDENYGIAIFMIWMVLHWAAIGIGAMLLVLDYLRVLNSKNKLYYSVTGIFNLSISLIYLFLLLTGKINSLGLTESLINLLIGVLIIVTIFSNKR